jgi:hypothetical protein
MTVSRRTVFYISGFDPRGPMHYHRLYREEAAKQAAVNGLNISVEGRRKIDDHEMRWQLKADSTVTDYAFLRWDDIIRARWPRGTWATYWDTVRYTAAFLRHGVFAMLGRESWPTLVTAVYSPLLLIFVLIASLTLAGLAGHAASLFVGPWGYLAGVPLLLIFYFARPVMERLNAFWLGRGCAFLADRARGATPDAEERCRVFAAKIIAEIKERTPDEVLLVSHSVGSHLAISTLAHVLQRDPAIASNRRTALAHLTVGQTVAMTACQRQAEWFRKQLKLVASDPALTWIDVTAAPDNTSIPLTDPLIASGLPKAVQPKLVSARYIKLFTPQTYRHLRRDFLRRHFQYLMAAERPGDYDYFQITAGPLTLEERFRGYKSTEDFKKLKLFKS